MDGSRAVLEVTFSSLPFYPFLFSFVLETSSCYVARSYGNLGSSHLCLPSCGIMEVLSCPYLPLAHLCVCALPVFMSVHVHVQVHMAVRWGQRSMPSVSPKHSPDERASLFELGTCRFHWSFWPEHRGFIFVTASPAVWLKYCIPLCLAFLPEY